MCGSCLAFPFPFPGISKASTAINVVLLIIAFWGLIASTRADFVWMAAHSALVFGILGIFTIYVFLTIAFGACVRLLHCMHAPCPVCLLSLVAMAVRPAASS